MQKALETAVEAARIAGALIDSRAEDIGQIRSKSSATDFVSDTDVAAGVSVVQSILNREPEASFVVEEPEVYEICGIEPGSLENERVWVVDPIDGTTSFLHGFPCFSVSVALLVEGQPVVGAVYNVALDEMNSAAVGMGAFCDGRRLEVSLAKSVPEALLVTGFPYDRTAPLDKQLAVLAAFLRAPVHGIRRDGSAAIDLCHVAGGRCDGYWEYSLKPWDMAAGVVICREAGAVVTDAEGNPWTSATTSLCVANPSLHEKMLEVVRAAGEVA